MNKNQIILKRMLSELAYAPRQVLPSKYWEELNKKNLEQLSKNGYRNFKRTVALNYFTWVVTPTDPQIKFLFNNLPIKEIFSISLHTFFSKKHAPMNILQSWSYTFLTRLIWSYASSVDKDGLLSSINEPVTGNPPRVIINNKLISQDLANSFLEYNSIFGSPVIGSRIKTVIELGPGYGRNAYVILMLNPQIKYILADIPPALYVAQRYFSEIFPNKKIFKFRAFKSFEKIRSEFEKADIVFFLPQQLEFLPNKYADLFINISSLHEMRPDQINYYLKQINRLTRKYFYLKEWIVSKIPNEEIIVREADYPIPGNWKKIYRRKCKVQTHFFEALFKIES